jgi:PPM family protein phosphatase
LTNPTTRVPLAQARMPWPEGAGLTHRGMVRERNEDSILTDPDGTLWAVSDGMGGYGYGDIASDITVDCLATIPDDAPDFVASLVDQLRLANMRVRDRAAELGAGVMGATAVAVIVARAIAHVAWVGDSRAYLLRHGSLRLLTRDHTVVQDLVDRGELSPEAASRHPEAHVITRAVGGEEHLEVDVTSVLLASGDWILLCSDGLYGCVYEARFAQVLSEAATPEDACRRLVTDALEAGAPDNVSVIALRMVSG